MLELLHKALLALAAGFSELVFASSAAHQLLYRTLTGYRGDDRLLSLGIHLGCFVALLVICQKRIQELRSEKKLEGRAKRRRGRQPNQAALMDIRILNAASITILLGFLAYRKIAGQNFGLIHVAVFLTVNGVILFLPRLFSLGNKNGYSFTQLDGTLMGLAGFLGMIPGFSRLGCMYSVGIMRGASKSYALDLSVMLSIPAIGALLSFDAYDCFFKGGNVTGIQLLSILVVALMAYIGAFMAIGLMRFICNRATAVGFAYYSCGLSVFMLLIYLFVA